jgi:hypothetical protein
MFAILGIEEHEQTRQFLLKNWSFKQEMELLKLVIPKDVINKMNKANIGTEYDWKYISDPLVPLYLLGLEAKLGAKNQITIGVVYSLPNQVTEEEMFNNSRKIVLFKLLFFLFSLFFVSDPEDSSHGFNQLLEILGEKIDIEGWKSYSGGFNPSLDTNQTYYSSWRGTFFVTNFLIFLQLSFLNFRN